MKTSNHRAKDNKPHVLSIRLKAQNVEQLQRFARQLGRSTSETAAELIEEGLKRQEFSLIDFRSTLAGRQAYVMGSSLAVWEVINLARGFSLDAGKTASHLDWPEFRVQAALNYAAAFPDEIEDAIADNASFDFVKLSRMLPQSQLFVAETAADKGGTRKNKRGSGKASS